MKQHYLMLAFILAKNFRCKTFYQYGETPRIKFIGFEEDTFADSHPSEGRINTRANRVHPPEAACQGHATISSSKEEAPNGLKAMDLFSGHSPVAV